MPVPREILDLVARFEQQFDAYKSGQYNETQVRREFLDPFFKALGWDIDNVQGFAEAYKDVVHEDQVRIGSVLKAPDYSFRIGGTRKYFLEAKKPSVVIKDEPAPAYQLRRYAWSAKLPLSILSDFEEFAVYDGRVKPHKDDSASTARIFYCAFRDYAEKWDWIYERFSRDAVLKGAFDKFAETTKTKRGTTEVDAAFLAEIEGWRSELARNLALRNAKLTQRELNFAVERIIDRLVYDLYGLTEEEIRIVEGKAEAGTSAAPVAEVAETTAKPKRARKAKGLYSQPVATQSAAESEPAAAAFYNATGKEEAPPYRTEGEPP